MSKMIFHIDDPQASAGMNQAIYQAIDAELRPPMEQQKVKPDLIEESQEAWKKLAFTIFTGVIEHLIANMEFFGIQTRGNINPTVQGNTGSADPGNHQHSINLSGVQNGVIFAQSNDGTGHVK